MKIETNVELSKYTTFKMGGIAKKIYLPETEQELIELVRTNRPQYYIGGGSNILINDEKLFDMVVNLRRFNTEIEELGDGEFFVGASVRLQKLIITINELGYGGIEYLFSVPGLVGGATIMNAGRGKKYNQCISDYIVDVKVFVNDNIMWVKKEDCDFSYRSSKLKGEGCIVLGVKFKFPKCTKENAERLRRERIQLCQKMQDNSAPNFGTVFCEANDKIMVLLKNSFLGHSGEIKFSKKTVNWMLNLNGTFNDALKLIERAQKIHCLFGKKCKTEVIIWK